ncbi:MAG: amidohydrolase family protein [Alphaproteobacteria bacterium]
MSAAEAMAENTYAGDKICFDADSHVMETFTWVKDHADPDLRDEIGDLYLGAAGAMAEKAIKAAQERVADKAATDKLAEDVIAGPKGWAALGAFDVTERSRAMDQLGFKAQLVFSTFAATQYVGRKDPRVLYGGMRAHNRAMAAFCADDPRLLGVGSLTLDDADRALAEANAAIDMGCKALWVPAAPAGDKSPGHPDYDPLWALLAERGVPFMLHIGQGTRLLPKAYENNGRERPTDFLGGGENIRVKDLIVLSFAPQMFLSAMVFDGVFARHPKLKGGVIELGAGWVPDFLATLDNGGKMFAKSDPAVRELEMKPSDYIRRQVWFTPFPSEDVGQMTAQAGDDLFLFSSDYPHPEGGRDPIGKFDAGLDRAGISQAARNRFYADNFRDMMGL